jgi:hypothetical protein
VKKLLLYLILLAAQSSFAQTSENCQNSSEYNDGKAWAKENLDLIKDTLYNAEGEIYLSHIRYLVCLDRDLWSPTKTELIIYNTLLSRDSIEIIECVFDFAGPCYTYGFNDELMRVLATKNLPKNYFKVNRKKAIRLAKKQA